MITVRTSRLCDGDSVAAVECLETDAVTDPGEKAGQKRAVFYLLPEDYAELNLRPGPLLPAEEELLRQCDERCRAVRTGRRLLGYSAQTTAGLENKLRARGFSRTAAAYACLLLLRQGCIDEGGDAVRFAELSVKKGRGRNRIVQDLEAKGFGPDAVNAAVSYLSGVDFPAVCRQVIRKKWGELPAEPAEKRKAVGALMRLGFSAAEITRAVKKKGF